MARASSIHNRYWSSGVAKIGVGGDAVVDVGVGWSAGKGVGKGAGDGVYVAGMTGPSRDGIEATRRTCAVGSVCVVGLLLHATSETKSAITPWRSVKSPPMTYCYALIT